VQALLDKNCLIDIADRRQPFADQLEPVIAAWRRGDLELIAAAITASENQPDEVPPTWEQFKDLLAKAGLADVRILRSTLTWDMGFWGEGLWADEDTIELERQIWAILPPNIDMDDTSDRWRWVNKKCDVMTVWTHVWHKTDVLLTRDDKMLGKAPALAALGARLELPVRFAASL
jgi:hypothetical protein